MLRALGQQKVLAPRAGLELGAPTGDGTRCAHSSSSPGAGCDLGSAGRVIINLPAKAPGLLFLEPFSRCLKQARPAWHLWEEEHPHHETTDKQAGGSRNLPCG